jgi:hypothetical protein
MRIRAAAILAFGWLPLAGCDNLTEIEVYNNTPQSITGVFVVNNHQRLELDDLQPGGSLKISQHFRGEGAPRLEWVYAGTRMGAELCYFTGGMPAKGTIRIYPERIERRCGS